MGCVTAQTSRARQEALEHNGAKTLEIFAQKKQRRSISSAGFVSV